MLRYFSQIFKSSNPLKENKEVKNGPQEFVPPVSPLSYAEALRDPPSYEESQAETKTESIAAEIPIPPEGKPKYTVNAISTPANLRLPIPNDEPHGFSLFTAMPSNRTTLDYRLNKNNLFVNPESSEEQFESFLGIKSRKLLVTLISHLLQENVDANLSRTLSDDEIKISPRDACIAFIDQNKNKKLLLDTDDKDNIKTLTAADIGSMKISPEQADVIERGRYINLTPFTGVSVPSMSIESYFNRLAKFIHCSSESFIIMLVLLERYINAVRFKHVTMNLDEIPIELEPDWLDEFNVYRLMLVALIVAAKFFDNRVHNNAHCANVGGIALKEMNALEREFLCAINHKTFVTPKEFQKTFFQLLTRQDLNALEDPENQIDPSSSLQLCNFFLIQNVLRVKETEDEWMDIITLLLRHLPKPLCNIVLTYHDIAPESSYIPRFFVANKDFEQVLHIESQSVSASFSKSIAS